MNTSDGQIATHLVATTFIQKAEKCFKLYCSPPDRKNHLLRTIICTVQFGIIRYSNYGHSYPRNKLGSKKSRNFKENLHKKVFQDNALSIFIEHKYIRH